MKAHGLGNLDTARLVDHFREVSARHGSLLNARKTQAANREYDAAAATRDELNTRGPAALPPLLNLLTATEPGTRYWAATALVKFASEKAERTLEELAATPMSQVGLSAALTLREWKSGRYPPS
ncbi:DUF2019 domain-containing protein [Myxococcus sp. AM009]|uniref:HEAT repeat domain-containing protein n=1 Tax=Myxococcus sp. AM009 TaxID=2745137 RepID=UPI0015954A87|nr:HEAT repeat domain-containing protein [Myxococcus sp. AM009]NVI97360.1 DUF2019 domain-containing protein [Myxococcus sp. AM009]